MGKDKIIASEQETYTKITRQEIEKRLTAAFTDLQKEIGDKKFKQRVKKASKLLSHGSKKKEKEGNKPVNVKSAEQKPKEVKKTVASKKAVHPKKATLKKTVAKKAVMVKK